MPLGGHVLERSDEGEQMKREHLANDEHRTDSTHHRCTRATSSISHLSSVGFLRTREAATRSGLLPIVHSAVTVISKSMHVA